MLQSRGVVIGDPHFWRARNIKNTLAIDVPRGFCNLHANLTDPIRDAQSIAFCRDLREVGCLLEHHGLEDVSDSQLFVGLDSFDSILAEARHLIGNSGDSRKEKHKNNFK